jgi:acyl-CoA reductase-like NAD-dependent aldehyde dehydrogenase
VSVESRAAALLAWADRLEGAAEALARTITTATGKPIRASRVEVTRALATLRFTAAQAARLQPEELVLPGAGRAERHRVPLGPVLAITPFNFPLNLALHKLAPALLAGCPVTWKPSPKAPGVAEAALALAGDLPVRLWHGTDQEVAQALTAPDLAVVSFTGSVAVGYALQARTTRARVLLELGGTAAVIIDDPGPLDPMAQAVALGAAGQAGQSCVSVQRIFVPRHRQDVVDALVQAFAALPHGDPWDAAVWCGPVIDDGAAARIAGELEGLRARGGRFLTGGTWTGRVLAPTLVDGLPPEDPASGQRELFAPIALLHRYDQVDDALAAVDATPFGLQAGLWSQDEAVIARAFARLQVGGLVINDVPTRRDDRLPYGGCRDSGNCREGALVAVDDYLTDKILWWPGAI